MTIAIMSILLLLRAAGSSARSNIAFTHCRRPWSFPSYFHSSHHSVTQSPWANKRIRPCHSRSQVDSLASSAQLEDDNNVPKGWKGETEKKSEFITHFVAGRKLDLTVEQAIIDLLPEEAVKSLSGPAEVARREKVLRDENDELLQKAEAALRHDTSTFPRAEEHLSAVDLLAFGSIWFLPSGAPRDPALGGKPIRLDVSNATRILEEGDYLRVHNPPRRFPSVNKFNWGMPINGTDSSGRKGVIVAQDSDIGYIVVDKPLGLPVHGTVDNRLENVAAAVGRYLLKQREDSLRNMIAQGIEPTDVDSIETTSICENSTNVKRKRRRKDKQKKDPLVYISNPQRLDQNTSGLFVLSTKKQFASYFAKLLRKKTDNQLSENTGAQCAVHKTYRCLVCVSQGRTDDKGTSMSMADEVDRLRKYAKESTIIRHYLEPSIKAPKNFSEKQVISTWAECLLRIKGVGEVYPIIGNDAAEFLSKSLWENHGSKPNHCVAVVEVEIELLTGRTHQIRGQLSAEGYPLVGDVGYGGAIPVSLKERLPNHIIKAENLALQCCELDFVEPDFVEKKGEMVEVRSKRWLKFKLTEAWWTPLLKQYTNLNSASGDAQATFSISDEEEIQKLRNLGAEINDISPNTEGALPRRVKLSQGKNKYVVILAKSLSSGESFRFIRSASQNECGGPYHADVARSLVEDLTARGYECKVEGGGRIDFVPPHAHVYGFSYGFGKGDHEAVSHIIEQYSDEETYATFDDSDGMY